MGRQGIGHVPDPIELEVDPFGFTFGGEVFENRLDIVAPAESLGRGAAC